jgi:hypothetical protein
MAIPEGSSASFLELAVLAVKENSVLQLHVELLLRAAHAELSPLFPQGSMEVLHE